jgi:integrase
MTRLPLKFVHAFIDRHGKVRHYFRRGGKRTPLPGLPGSEQFMAAYQAAEARAPAPVTDIGASRTEPGTINALVVLYYKSADWNAHDPGTRKDRRPIIERFRVANGNKRVALLHRDHIEKMMADIPNLYARRHWLKAIRPLLKSAIPSMRKDDPTAGIAGVKLPKTKGHHSWTDDEIQQYRDYWPLGTPQRLVMEFALEAVSRRCEVVRLGPQHVKDGRIRIERSHGSKDVDIPVSPELQAACEAMPKGHALYLTTAHGEPRSAGALGHDFAKWATEAGLPNRCRMHGLKKGGMRRLADAGATTHELMAISGHRDLSMVQLYCADYNDKKLADSGMKKKVGGQIENAEVANLPAHRRQTPS